MADNVGIPDPVLYVCVRPLKSMNNGKAQAHSGHASCAFLFKAMTEHKSHNSPGKWISSTSQGFGTQVNLKAPSDEAWLEFVKEQEEKESARYMFDVIIDPTYPYIVSDEMKDLIDPDKHSLPPRFNPKKNEWMCFRPAPTAFYIFDNCMDTTVKDLLKKNNFILHP